MSDNQHSSSPIFDQLSSEYTAEGKPYDGMIANGPVFLHNGYTPHVEPVMDEAAHYEDTGNLFDISDVEKVHVREPIVEITFNEEVSKDLTRAREIADEIMFRLTTEDSRIKPEEIITQRDENDRLTFLVTGTSPFPVTLLDAVEDVLDDTVETPEEVDPMIEQFKKEHPVHSVDEEFDTSPIPCMVDALEDESRADELYIKKPSIPVQRVDEVSQNVTTSVRSGWRDEDLQE